MLAGGGAPRGEGVGACEAPRGTLLHHYAVDRDGVVTRVTLLVATAQNQLAMGHTVRRVAERHVEGGRVTPGLVERVGAAIRAFDPCLSCAAHADGAGGLAIRVVGPRGEAIAVPAR